MRAGREGRGKRESARRRRGRAFDRRLVAVAAVVTVALLAIARCSVDPTGPAGWSWPVLMLCVLAAAVAGRALTGYRNAEEGGVAQAPSRRVRVAIWLLLLAAAIGPNLHSLGIGFLADDFGLLRGAKLMGGPIDAARIRPLPMFYRPVSLLVWWLGLQLWQGSALGYHLFSLLLHAANTALVYLLARRYVGSMYGGAMAAALFAVHPLHVETTLWAAAQPDLLCTAFSLASMWCLEYYLGAPRGCHRALAVTGALAAYLLALLSKEVAIVLPVLVFVRLAMTHPDRRTALTRRLLPAYAAVLAGCLVLRFLILGRHALGGYGVRLLFWNTVFPSMPLLLTEQFFFPVHRGLFRSILYPYLSVAAIAAMAVGLLWWMRSLAFAAWQRLTLYASYLFVPAIPVWTLTNAIDTNMENSRYAYLPSVGLALLFGEICARRGPFSTRVIGSATILVAAALSVWYVLPWKDAARLRDDLLRAGTRLVEELPERPPPQTVFVKGLPFDHLGAPVFVNGYSMALAPLLRRQVSVKEIRPTHSALDAMAASDLLPGEYLVAWDRVSRSMVVERSGPGVVAQRPRGAPP